jgi:uncharacterized membrane-anchored protein YitT (DUF2179 family)
MQEGRSRNVPRIQVGSPFHVFMEYVLLMFGSFLIAISFNLFLNPNQIASGGVAGISTIIQYMFGIEPALTQWLFNIPLFIVGAWLLGRRFGLKTAIASVVLPLFVLFTGGWEPLTENILLATVYGGIGIGAGIGIVFRGRGSTGGLDLAAQILHKYTGLTLGLAIAVLDGIVILTAGIVFSPEKALYALIGLFVTSKTIDVVSVGFSNSKVAFIISDHSEALKDVILYELDRGLTQLSGVGGYTGTDRYVMMVVIKRREVVKLKAMVRAVDPKAFIILSDTTEVLGEGFNNAASI